MATSADVQASSRNLKYMHVLSIWSELAEIVGGDRQIAAMLTAAYFCSQLAGSTPNPHSNASKRARKRRDADENRAVAVSRRGNPRNKSKPNRPKH